ncbi:MAG: heme exporter protein CcmB [Hyphomonadaceae bacterium JAD_PAG50586_4]|nr:MAG: heme exporter protein CcmB [Hyphomonadaceae bacterium JAD_PAG50586_4]
MSALAATFRRDLALMWGGGGGALAPLGFFLGATMLVPLAMGPERNLLAAAGPLWCGSRPRLPCSPHWSVCFKPISKTARLITCCFHPRRSK